MMASAARTTRCEPIRRIFVSSMRSKLKDLQETHGEAMLERNRSIFPGLPI